MKGIILSINPRCTLVDITHHINPQDIEEGASILANAYAFFPKGTIHLAIVDPGVGGPRRPILFVTGGYFFVGPDNGLFTIALQREKVKEAVVLTEESYFLPDVSCTFHGRDLFAPVAGHLSLGVNPTNFGQKVDSWTELSFREPRTTEGKLVGEIVYVDAFGNLISNIDKAQLSGFAKSQQFIVRIGKKYIEGLKRGYWEGKKNELIALIGSGGFLEISVREGNARERVGAKKGDRVVVERVMRIGD